MFEGGSGSAPGATVVATVKWYDPVKGFGFLASTDGSRDLFCHVSAVSGAGLLTLPEGATVSCEVERGPRGPQVSRIHAVDAPPASTGPAGSGGLRHRQHGHEHGEQGPSSGRRLVATVKWFVPSKGFGFLVPDDGSPDVFCHASVVQEAGYDTLPQGANVTCIVTESRRGPVVASILGVDASTAPGGNGGRELTRKPPRHPLPCALVGRLAVDRSVQGCGIGRMLLADAVRRVAGHRRNRSHARSDRGCRERDARRFYEGFDFVPLLDDPMRLFLALGHAAMRGSKG